MKYAEDLKAFVDGELPLGQMMAIRTAMDTDPQLRREVAFMKLLGDSVREEANVPELKVENAQKVVEKLPKGKPPFLTFLKAQPVAWVGALVLLVAVLVVAGRGMSGTGNTSYASSGLSSAGTVASGHATILMGSPAEPQSEMRVKHQFGTAPQGQPETSVAKHGVPDVGVGGAGFTEAYGYNLAAPSAGSRPYASGSLSPAFSPPGGAGSLRQLPTAQNLLSAPSNRKVIQNASLEVVTDDVASAQANAVMAARAFGGYVESSALNYSDGVTPTATITLRVPAAGFDNVVSRLEGLGKLRADNITGQDVTAQYADTDARLKELQAEADDYITMLRGAKTIGQILEIKDRLSDVRQDIGSYQEQLSALKDQSMLSSIALTLDQKPKPGTKPSPKPAADTWAPDTWGTAVSGLSSVGKFLGQCVIFLFVYSPIWLPIMAIVWWVNKRSR